jgi:hypothetical protein
LSAKAFALGRHDPNGRLVYAGRGAPASTRPNSWTEDLLPQAVTEGLREDKPARSAPHGRRTGPR